MRTRGNPVSRRRSRTAGTYGSFGLTTAGVWTYTLDNSKAAVQALTAGQTVTDKFSVVSSDGTANTTVTITITGVNDVPVLGGTATGGVTEDAVPNTATGTLTIADADAGQSSFTAQAGTAGTYGSFDLTTAGDWTYTLDNSKAAAQALTAGQTVTDKFSVVSSDGTASTTVTITVTGVNDVPTISDIANQAATENTVTGAIAFTVADAETAAETLSVSVTSSDAVLVPVQNIVFGGSGANRTVTITPAANQTGAATITISVSDADLGAVSDSFVLTVLPDEDADGVANTVEAGAGNGTGDGNNDGFPDGQQENVSSLPNADGLYVTLEAPAERILENVQAIAPADLPPLPTGVELPAGVFAFDVVGGAFGAPSTVTFFLPDPPAGKEYNAWYKYGLEPGDAPGEEHWYEFRFDGTTGAEISGNTVTLHFVDGQRGDDDLSANGVIADPGAPALTPNDPVAKANGPYSVDEATDSVVLNSQGSFDADNPGDPLTYDWDLDYNGIAFDVDVSDDPSPAVGPFDDSGTRTIALRVTNGRGAMSIATADLTVENVAPTLVAQLVDDGFDGVVGQDRTILLKASDPSLADTQAGFSYEVDWGDNSPREIFTGPKEAFRSHAYTKTGAFKIQVWARDKDLGVSDPQTVNVNIAAVELKNGVLAVGGTAADDVLTVDLSKSSTSPSIKLNTTVLTLAPVTHIKFFGSAGTDTVRVSGTAGNDVITITSQGVALGPVLVEGAGVEKYELLGLAGNDTFHLVSGAASVDGGKGTNTLIGPDQATTWEITGKNAGTLKPSTSGQSAFKLVQEVKGGTAADLFRFAAKGSLTGKVDGGGGEDTLDFGLRTAAVTVNLQTSKVTGTGGFLGIEAFQGGGGAKDAVTGPDSQNTWSITGANQALLNGAVTLVGFESLKGGAAQDEFDMGASGALGGTLDGGKGGSNILSYAGRSANVVVDLGKSKAASITGKVTNFTVLIGGNGDDTLTGNAKTSTVIVGGGGIDILTGGSLRDILIGGAGADTLTGGTGANKIVGGSGTNEDLLIGGATSHDSNGSALLSLLAEWTSSRSYNDRVANLRGTGIGVRANGNAFLQNTPTDTLLGDANSIDSLTGALGNDYFIAGVEDLLNDLVAATELVDNP